MLVAKQLLIPTDFHGMEHNTMGVSGYQKLCGYSHSSKYLLLFSAEEEIHTDLEQLEVDRFSFWENYPFK